MNIYDFTVKTRKGEDVALSDFRGKVLLVVNTATGCGFTPQYKELQEIYDADHDKGLEILDFPCNQFGHQAPGTSDEIHSFCTSKYDVSFRQFAKIEVNGAGEDPLYTFLKKEKGGVLGSKIKWNFTKFLVDRSGQVVGRFAPTDTPEKIDASVAGLV